MYAIVATSSDGIALIYCKEFLENLTL